MNLLVSTNLIEIEHRLIVRTEIDGARLLTDDLTARLNSAVDQAEDLNPEAIVLFHIVGCQNVDSVDAWPGQSEIQAVSRWERLLRRVERTGLVTMCLVEHACSTLALELLLVTDRRWATRNFSTRIASPARNIWPGMSLYRLARELGERRAHKLLLDRRDIDPQTAEELNIVDEVLEDPANAFDRIAALLMDAPLDDFAVRRRLMQDSLTTSFDDALGVHLAACDRQFRRSSAVDDALTPLRDAASAD
jgi:isomerase DpgB